MSAGAACATLVSGEREALACGGCFHEAPTPAKPIVESSVVSDHRMVFALAPQQTVLWDQIRYNGNPKDFVWVLPVRPGTKIELSRDQWIAALDGTTQTQIIQPRSQPMGGFGGGGNFGEGSDSAGCACGTLSSDSTSALAGSASADGGAAPPPPPAVQVVSQEVVGPYETVIVRSDKPKALEQWLRDHGYAIPDSVLPIIEAYTTEHMDFVALRLRPGENVRAMQPVRIVSPGADPSLPLRMVAAGVGAHVGLTLYVISEGRYRPQNFPEAQIDEKKLVWDPTQQRSNYQVLASSILAEGGGRTWLTEYAGQPTTTGSYPQRSFSTLYDAYYGACQGQRRPNVPIRPQPDAGDPDASGGDAGAPDASDPDAGAQDAGDPDGGASDDGGVAASDGGSGLTPDPYSAICNTGSELCCDFDDLEVALGAMHRSDVWITRMRADLPASALALDLRLEAHPSQTTVSNVHNAALPNATGTTARIAPVRSTNLRNGLVAIAAALVMARIARRRTRRA